MTHRVALVLLLAVLSSACARNHYFQTGIGSVSFYYRDSQAREVFFAASTDHYQYHAASRIQDDLWKIDVPSDNEFAYFYVVDGTIIQPDCRLRENDDFGASNCLYAPDMYSFW